jgi:hypothetical protein
MSAEPADDPARARFFTIQAVRLTGVACVVLGMLIASQRIAWSQWLGYLLLVIGLIDVLVVPTLLARRWRTPR